MTVYLRGSNDFQKVYRKGKRYEGVLMTAFVLPNNLSHNRFGVTASQWPKKRATEESKTQQFG